MLMEQVLAPRFEFRPKRQDSGPTDGFNDGEGGYDPNKNNVGFNPVRGLLDAPEASRGHHAKEEIRHTAIWCGAVF